MYLNGKLLKYNSGMKKEILLPFFCVSLFLFSLFPFQRGYAETAGTAYPAVIENTPWHTVAEGYKLKRVVGRRSGDGLSFELLFLRFDSSNYALEIRKAETGETLFVNAFSALEGDELAVINGGYFDAKGIPLGFLKINGHSFSSHIARHGLYSGFLLPGHSPVVIHRDRFQKEANKNALQAGPLLIRNGRRNPGLLHADAAHYRSGIAVDRSGNFLLYVTNTNFHEVSWNDLLSVLLMPQFDILNALNLDGGASTQLYYKADGEKTFIRGFSTVPTAVVVRQKRGDE